MADEQVILDYIVRAQDQARGLLAAQLALLQQMSTQVANLATSQQRQTAAAAASARANAQQGDSLDRLIRLHDQLQKQQQRVIRGFEAMNVSLQQGGKLNQVQVGWLNSLNKAVQQNTGFMSQHGAAWNGLMGQMRAGTTLTPQLVGQFTQLGRQFQATTAQGQQQASTLQLVNAASTAAAAAIGGLGATITNTLIGALQEAIRQASLFQTTFLGLGTIAKSFGQDVGATTEAARMLASDGLMSVRESAAGLRNLLMAGFGLPEAIRLMEGFKDIAAFNRQASLEFGYAIVSATEGIKNQNSLLVDNAGLTKNLTIILKEMGLSEQDLAKVQTDVNIRTKFYNGLLKEMSVATGDAQRLTETYAGANTALTVQLQLLAAEIGSHLLPLLTPLIKGFADFIGWLRNSESLLAGITRVVAGAAAGFAAFAAIGVTVVSAVAAITGAVMLLGPALTQLGWTLAGATAAIGGFAAAATLIVAGVAMISGGWESATDAAQKNIDMVTRQNQVLTEHRDRLVSLRESSADASTVSQGLRDAMVGVGQVIPNTKIQFKDLDDTIKDLNTTLDQNQTRLNAFTLNKVEAELLGFGSTIEDQMNALNDTRLMITRFRDDLDRVKGTGEEAGVRAMIAGLEESEQAISGLLAQRKRLMAATKEQSEADREAVQYRRAVGEEERRVGELIKGQITTREEYARAAEKLQQNLALLETKHGISREAAMRLPEIVKQARELTTAAREGVAPMNQIADAIVKRGEAIERARRLEQEAAEHAREFENRARALTRAFGDQTVGVDSLAKKSALLTTVMRRVGVGFGDSRDELRPFIPLMEEIVERVDDLGEKAPANIDLIRAALEKLSIGTPATIAAAENLAILERQAKETARAMAALRDQRAEALLVAEGEADVKIQEIRQRGLELAENSERDSLAKRQRAVMRQYQQNTKNLDLSLASDRRIHDAHTEYLREQMRQLGIAWGEEFYGPTREDLQKTADESRKRWEDMKRQGIYTAQQVRDAWLQSYEDQQTANKSARDVFMDSMRDTLSMIARMSEQLATIAGEGDFAGIVRQIGLVAQSMEIADEAGRTFNRGMASISDGDIAAGIADIAASAMQMVQAFMAATQSSSRLSNALSGAMTGAAMGAQVGGAYGAIAGAIIGAIAGAFRKPEWGKIKDQIADDLGLSISKELAKSIEDLKKKLGTTRDDAIALSLSAIMAETGAPLAAFETQITRLFELAQDTSSQIGKLAIDQLSQAFAQMTEEMDTRMNGLADGPMLAFIDRVRESGVEVQAVTEFLREMSDRASEAMNKVVGGIVGGFVRQTGELRELVDDVLPKLLEKEDELLDKIAEEKDPKALRKLNDELTKVREELTKAFTEADRLNGGVQRFGIEGQAAFDRTSRLMATTFAAGLGAGKSFIDMLTEMGPSFDTMEQAMKDFGFEATAGFQSLLALRGIVNDNKELAESIDGLNQLMKSLHNLGAINADTFKDLGQTAVDMRSRLVDAGASGDQALQLMQPTLQTLWELQQRFGYKTDEATQALLDEAAAAGMVGKAHMSAQDRMAGGIEKLVDRMERLLGFFGVDFPREAEQGSGTAAAATAQAGTAVDDVSQRLQGGITLWGEWGNAAHEAGMKAYEAQMGVVHGHSPGGLVDIQSKLDALKKQWADQGNAARGGMEEADKAVDKHLKTLEKVMNTLRRAGMNDFQRTLDDIETRRQSAIESFIEDMKGASQELIKMGIDAINKTADIEGRNAVWDERHRQAKEAAEQAKKYADTLRDVMEELGREQAGEGIEGKLLELSQQRQRAIEDFMENMQGASQDAITAGLRAIEQIFGIRVRRAQEEHQQEMVDSARDHAKTLADLYRELVDAQIAGITDQTERTRAQLQTQMNRRLEDLRVSLGGETAEYHQQAAVIRQIYAQLFANIRETQSTSMRDLFRELEDAQTSRLGNSFAQQERLLRRQFDRRLADLATQLGAESGEYRQQAAVIEQIYNEMFGALQDSQREGLRDLQQELEDLIVGGMEDGVAREQRQLQLEHDRRMQQLRDQFGEESDAYREQAAILEEIFRIKNQRLTEEDQKGQRARIEEEIRALETAYYGLFNTAITPGQEAQRQKELALLAEKVIGARARLGAAPTSANGSLWAGTGATGPREAVGTMTHAVEGGMAHYGGTGEGALTAARSSPLSTMRLVIVVEDPNGRVLSETELQSVEEAMETGKIRVNTRSLARRT